MKILKIAFLAILTFGWMGPSILNAQSQEEKKYFEDFELEVEGEYRYFYQDAAFAGQENGFPSIALTPNYSIEWNRGNESINIAAFYRFDRDKMRTHGDIRELYYQKAKDKWEFNIGLKKVYWGVAESNHLVDIINQTDQIESFDGEDKLGQPMVQFTYSTESVGNFDFYYLPYHRKRVFPGAEGRMRFPIVIDKDFITYESGAKEWRQDLAFRWSHYFGAFDIGLSHFYGNGREPEFTFEPNGGISAFYPVINQTGLDLQITHNAFLWKFESIYRSSNTQDFLALVAGLEFTFSNIDGNGLDIGLLGEYLYDERDEMALSSAQNDLFIGSRIAFNDTQDTAILIGGMADLEKTSRIFSVEASRRLGNTLRIELEARIFSNIDPTELILSNFSEDSFLRFSLSKFF